MGRIGLELLSSEETIAFGIRIAKTIEPGTILALFGELGAGKTTFVQGLAQGLGIMEPIQSPTFVTLNQYVGLIPLYHFDLYRLKTASDFLALGFEEYFHKNGICAIEWPERIASLLPEKTLSISFTYTERGRLAIPC